ncbi:facilitated trehalose transporter Tret1-like [Schistocerca gregaria]|uniref:facilitated trehalose transporter Tret1-like n=1 Tax=Schistocerca gregaria TaxID=7010 RepID=UPI00211E3921|nr:facilitated trehalose transporter Tret1-like [Schistocerca gregaria]
MSAEEATATPLRVAEAPSGKKKGDGGAGGGRGGVRKQYIAAIAANLSAVAAGAVLGWSSPALVRMPLNPEQQSWAGSLVAVGATLGPWAGGWATGRVGRRGTLLWGALPYLLGWALLMGGLASYWLLLAARVLLGVAVGVTFTALPMYVAEIAEASVRGALGSLLQLEVSAGMLLIYVVGPYVTYHALAAVCVAVPAVFAAVFFTRPESPYFFLYQGNDGAAERALRAVRGDDEDISAEFSDMQEAVEDAKKNEASFRDLVSTRGNVRALYLTLGLMTFQQLSGINAMLFFGEAIFKMTGSSIDSSVSLIIVGFVMLAASCTTPLLADRLGRRIMLVASAIGMCISQVVLAIYFQMASSGKDVSSLGWLPVTTFVMYIAVYPPGFGALPWAVMSELFPANVKSVASSLSASVCWFQCFLITKFFADLVAAVGEAAPFFGFGACCVAAALFVYFLLPETKGRTLEEIQDILNSR